MSVVDNVVSSLVDLCIDHSSVIIKGKQSAMTLFGSLYSLACPDLDCHIADHLSGRCIQNRWIT